MLQAKSRVYSAPTLKVVMNKEKQKRIWFCGIPGSKWSGIDIHMRQVLPCDRTDETMERTQYHRPNTPGDANNGHRGSYWGPGMGCGADWEDFNFLTPQKLITDIDAVFDGDGYRIIKSHNFARHFNLDFIWNNFPDDYLCLIHREPQKSFAWWSQVMCFDETHYPDYRPGYKNYDRMYELLWQEQCRIDNFAVRKGMQFSEYTGPELFKNIPGYDKQLSKKIKNDIVTANSDVYLAITKIS